MLCHALQRIFARTCDGDGMYAYACVSVYANEFTNSTTTTFKSFSNKMGEKLSLFISLAVFITSCVLHEYSA